MFVYPAHSYTATELILWATRVFRTLGQEAEGEKEKEAARVGKNRAGTGKFQREEERREKEISRLWKEHQISNSSFATHALSMFHWISH